MTRSIQHEGLKLYPLTPNVIAARPEFDPWQHDENILSLGDRGGWVNFEVKREPPRLIRRVCRPDDALYYWDGPWGALSGSNGIAVVRDGRVVDMFTIWMS